MLSDHLKRMDLIQSSLQVLIQARFWAALTVITGFIGIFGWISSTVFLTRLTEESIPIAPNTAVLFLLLGLSIALPEEKHLGKHIHLPKVLALSALLITGSTILDILLGYPLGVDHILVGTVQHPYLVTQGHMSPVTALLFLLTLSGVLVHYKERRSEEYLGLILALAGGILVVGYLYWAPFLYTGPVIPVAFPTACAFTFCGIGLYLRSDPPFMRADKKTEQIVRYQILTFFLPFTIGILLLEGWVMTILMRRTDNELVMAVSLLTLTSTLATVCYAQKFSQKVATTIDTAERERDAAEEALLDSISRKEIATDAAGMGFWTWNLETGDLLWDEKTYDLYHIPRGERVTFQRWLSIIYPEDKPDPDIGRRMKRDENFRSEIRILLPDQSIRTLEVHGRKILNEKEKREGIIGINWDISDKVRIFEELQGKKEEIEAANEELTSQEEELRHQYRELAEANAATRSISLFLEEIITQAGEGIIVIDREGDVQIWNRFMEEYTGIASIVAVGRKVSENLPSYIADRVEPFITRALSGEVTPIPDTEFRYRNTGDTGWFTATCAPRYVSGGDVTGVIITAKDITARKKVERRLLQNQALLRTSQSMAKVGGWELDLQTGQIYWTDEMYRIYSLDPGMRVSTQEDQHLWCFPCYQEEDQQRIQDVYRRCADNGEPFELELPMRTASGEDKWVRIRGEAEWEGEDLVKIHGSVLDVTRERAFINEIERERQSLKDILDKMPDGVYMVDDEYRIQYTNPEIKRLFGEPGERLCYEYLHGGESPCLFCQNKRVFSGESVRWEWENPQSGRVYDLFDTPFTGPEGQIFKLEFFHDITSLRHAEQRLLEMNEYLSRLLRYANVPILVWNSSNQIQEFNFASEHLSGYTRTAVLGRAYDTLFPPEMRWEVLTLFGERMQDGVLQDLEIPIQKPDGSKIPVIWNAARIKDYKGDWIATIAQGRDVSRERLLEEEKLMAIRQLKLNFAELAILNDGIRNPLTIIGVITEMNCPTCFDAVEKQIIKIDQIVQQLDTRWVESESVLNFIQKHYQIRMEDILSGVDDTQRMNHSS